MNDPVTRHERWYIGLCVLLVVLLPILVKLPVLSGARSLNPALWVANAGATASMRRGIPFIDPNVGFQGQALGKLSADDILAGHMPWWNPYNGVGLPLAAEAQPASLFVPFVLAYHFRDGPVWVKIVLQIIAGLCTLAFFRKLGLTIVASGLGAILYELNGTFAWHGAPIMAPIAFLPMLLLGVEILIDRINRHRAGGWVVISVALAWSIYAGFPETAYLDGLFVALWVIFRLPALPARTWLPFIGKLGLSLLTGILCSLLLIVPFAQFVGLSYVGNHGGAFANAALPHASAALTLLPRLFGPIWAFNDPTNTIGLVWANIGGYVPAVLVMVGLYAVLVRPRRLLWAPAIWVVLCAGRIFGINPIDELMNMLPGMRSVAAFRYATPSMSFAVIVLVAAAVDTIHRSQSARTQWVRACIAFGAAAVLSGVALWLAREPLAFLLQSHPPALYAHQALAALAITLVIALVILLWHGKGAAKAIALSTLLAAAAIFAFTLPMSSAASNPRYQEGGVTFMQRHVGLGRVYSLGTFAPNYGAFFGVPQINYNYLPVTTDWVDYIHTHLNPTANPVYLLGADSRGSTASAASDLRARLPAYERMAVRYVVTRPGDDPFVQSIATRNDTSSYHAPMQLQNGIPMSLTWSLDGAPNPRTIKSVSVVVGTYAGKSNGSLTVSVCLPTGNCATGSRDIRSATDNEPFQLTLAHSLVVPASENRTLLGIQFVQRGSSYPIAFWLQELKASRPRVSVLSRLPRMNVSPALRLTFVDTAVDRASLAYSGADMQIYRLRGASPYFNVRGGGCSLAPISRTQVHVRCKAPAVLVRREAFYPGWTARVGNRVARIFRSNGIFQSVSLPIGKYDVTFRYQPTHYRAMMAGFLLGILILVIGLVLEVRYLATGRASAISRLARLGNTHSQRY